MQNFIIGFSEKGPVNQPVYISANTPDRFLSKETIKLKRLYKKLAKRNGPKVLTKLEQKIFLSLYEQNN